MKELEGILDVMDNAYSDLRDVLPSIEDEDDYTTTEVATRTLKKSVWLLNEVVTKQRGG